MLVGSKLKASQGTCTIAISIKPQRVKMTQNSPKAGQNKTKNMLEHSQHMLELEAWNMEHIRPMRRITLHLPKPSMRWLHQQKSKLYHGKTRPKHTDMAAQKLRQDGIHNGSFLKHKEPTLQSIEWVKDVRAWPHYMHWNHIPNDAKSCK